MSKQNSSSSPIRMRMVWRLVWSLCLHLTLLLFLAIYLAWSIDNVRSYAPDAMAQEIELESIHTIPALLGGMDTERRSWEKDGDPQDLANYTRMRGAALANLASLNTPLLLPSAAENERRALAKSWITDVGDVATSRPWAKASGPTDAIDAQSEALLDKLHLATAQAETDVQTKLTGLQNQQAADASGLVDLMWFGVGTVFVFTLVFQAALANSIIGPIQVLTDIVRRLQSGDYTARAHLTSGDEIQNLGEAFNAMARSILRTQSELQDKNERLSAQQDALRNANAGLEARVDLKTKELEDKNEKLHEAARQKDEFLATLSHELRTPLTPIISCAHLLNTDPQLAPDELKNVQVIDRNARALSRMIDELLDLSAVMNRKLRLVKERTEMNEWTRATLETVRPEWEKKKLEVVFVPENTPVELDIDPMRLAQVVTNLLTNAIKYTDAPGKITVRLTSEAEGICIAVTDTGAGLNQHEIDRIFEMFHQSRTTQTRSVGGLGVGLTVARSLAELHGGGLLAESPGEGLGATFTLWLPRLADSQAVDFSSPSLTPLPAVVDRRLLRGRRILLVEDSLDTREALERIFQRRGCDVTSAETGEDAMKLIQHEPPEIIISDIGLPGMSGLEFMRKVREHPEWKDVIAIALSGLGREQDIDGAAEAGFDAHLLKPVDITVLDQTLVQALQKKTEEREEKILQSSEVI